MDALFLIFIIDILDSLLDIVEMMNLEEPVESCICLFEFLLAVKILLKVLSSKLIDL